MAGSISNIQLEALSPASPQSAQTPAVEICRICFGSESTESNELIRPCKCSGSMAFIHLQCLKSWVDCKSQSKPECEICKTPFRIETISKNVWSIRHFAHSSACLILPLTIPISAVLIVAIVSCCKDLSDGSNLGALIGCLVGLGVLALLASLLVVKACRTKRVMHWNVLPQEDSASYALSANC